MLFTLLRFPFHNYQPYLKEAGTIEPLFADGGRLHLFHPLYEAIDTFVHDDCARCRAKRTPSAASTSMVGLVSRS